MMRVFITGFTLPPKGLRPAQHLPQAFAVAARGSLEHFWPRMENLLETVPTSSRWKTPRTWNNAYLFICIYCIVVSSLFSCLVYLHFFYDKWWEKWGEHMVQMGNEWRWCEMIGKSGKYKQTHGLFPTTSQPKPSDGLQHPPTITEMSHSGLCRRWPKYVQTSLGGLRSLVYTWPSPTVCQQK